MSRRDNWTKEPVALLATRKGVLGLLKLIFRVRVSGLECLPRTGPVLVAGNHSGFLDGPIVFMALPRPSVFLVKSEMFDSGFRRVLAFARQVPVHRGTPDRTALGAGIEVLAAGGVVAVFPEGTRGTGELTSIQHGIGYLAVRAKCSIVPVVCRGTADALPKGKAFPRWRAPIEVTFGPAFGIEVTGDPRSRAAMAAAAEQIRLGLLAHLAANPAVAPPQRRASRPA